MSRVDPNDRRHTVRRLVTAAIVFLTIGASTTDAASQGVELPRLGKQYGSVGVMIQPGFVHDPTFPRGTGPSGEQWNRLTPAAGGVAQFAFHQIVTHHFLMTAEAQLGLQWLDEHTVHREGRTNSETVFAWQLGLLARWLPAGEQAGWQIGAGPSLYRAYLDDSALQMLGVDLRAGRFLWQSDEDFVLMEIGYVIPAIQGLDKPPDFSAEPNEDAPSDWTFHRFGLSVQYGF